MPDETSGDVFGPKTNADETRQAGHLLGNDVPLDVNFNAAATRSQHLTIDVLGKGYQASQERRQIIADLLIRPTN